MSDLSPRRRVSFVHITPTTALQPLLRAEFPAVRAIDTGSNLGGIGNERSSPSLPTRMMRGPPIAATQWRQIPVRSERSSRSRSKRRLFYRRPEQRFDSEPNRQLVGRFSREGRLLQRQAMIAPVTCVVK